MGNFPQQLRPYQNITPFTYRDGLTYLEVLESLRNWLGFSLVPFVDDEINLISESFKTEVSRLIAHVDAALLAQAENVDAVLADQITNVANQLATQNTNVANQLANQNADVANQLAENVELVNTSVINLTTFVNTSVAGAMEYVDDAVADIIGSTITVTDPVMVGVGSNLDSEFSKLFANRGVAVSVIEYGAQPTTDVALVDSSTAFENAFGPGGRTVNVPKGIFYISRPIKIGPNSNIVCHPETIIKLMPLARCKMFYTDATGVVGSNGVVSWSGGTIDGRDADQGEWTLGGNGFDVSKGLVLTKCAVARIERLTVRRIRGHSINHWNNDYFIARDITIDQGLDGSQPAGGRRRDGVTGVSTHIDISGVSGYSGDDLVAVGAGMDWGSSEGNGTDNGVQDVVSVRVTNIRPGLSKQDSTRRAWRGVAVYAKNGRGIASVVIDDVAGHTTLSHVAFLTNSLDGSVGGYVTSANVSNVSGTNHSSTDYGTMVFIDNISIKNLNIRNVYHRPSDTLMALPSLNIRNGAAITNLTISGFKRDLAQTDPLISMLDNSVVNVLTLNACYAPGVLLRKNVSNATDTSTRGVQASDVQRVAGSIVRAETYSTGNGVDANTLIEPGNYANTVAGSNWPRAVEATGQQMVVTRIGLRVQQSVFTMAGAAGKIYIRASMDAGVTWVAWATVI